MHKKNINSNEFEWKGCWICRHFKFDEDFPYVGASEAAIMIEVSPSTIRRWIKQEKLGGVLFTRGRTRPFMLASRKKWFVQKSDIEKLLSVEKSNL